MISCFASLTSKRPESFGKWGRQLLACALYKWRIWSISGWSRYMIFLPKVNRLPLVFLRHLRKWSQVRRDSLRKWRALSQCHCFTRQLHAWNYKGPKMTTETQLQTESKKSTWGSARLPVRHHDLAHKPFIRLIVTPPLNVHFVRCVPNFTSAAGGMTSKYSGPLQWVCAKTASRRQ